MTVIGMEKLVYYKDGSILLREGMALDLLGCLCGGKIDVQENGLRLRKRQVIVGIAEARRQVQSHRVLDVRVRVEVLRLRL